MTLQVAAISSPSAVTVSEGQLNFSRSISVCVPICGSENNQVPPASHAKPGSHSFTVSGPEGCWISVMVFRSMIDQALAISHKTAVVILHYRKLFSQDLGSVWLRPGRADLRGNVFGVVGVAAAHDDESYLGNGLDLGE